MGPVLSKYDPRAESGDLCEYACFLKGEYITKYDQRSRTLVDFPSNQLGDYQRVSMTSYC